MCRLYHAILHHVASGVRSHTIGGYQVRATCLTPAKEAIARFKTEERDNLSGAVPTVTARNQLKVTPQGSTVNMFVNGTQVCEPTGAVLTEGQMGLAAGWAAADVVSLAFDG